MYLYIFRRYKIDHLSKLCFNKNKIYYKLSVFKNLNEKISPDGGHKTDLPHTVI